MSRTSLCATVLAVILLAVASRSGFGGTIHLPQTGQKVCYGNAAGLGDNISCSGTGQDGEIKAGVEWPEPRFTIGGGAEAGCITDKLTGLMWARNANMAGDPKTWKEALDCVTKLNGGVGLCNHRDWRLPNVNELLSLINFGAASNISAWLTSQGFIDVQAAQDVDGFAESDYWSSTTDPFFPNQALTLSMSEGGSLSNFKSVRYFLWPVRDGQVYGAPARLPKTGQIASDLPGDDGDLQAGAEAVIPRFVATSSGTVIDNLTRLEWTRNANAPGPAKCGPGQEKAWQAALDHVGCLKENRYLGHDDWRLPNALELASLLDYSAKANSSLLSLAPSHSFTNVRSRYWTSTPRDPFNACEVDVTWGLMNCGSNIYPEGVWPVRGGCAGRSGGLEFVSPRGCFESDEMVTLQARAIPAGAPATNAEYYLDSNPTPSGPLIPVLRVIIAANTFPANTIHTVKVTADVGGCPVSATQSFRVAAPPNLRCPGNIDVRLKPGEAAVPATDSRIATRLRATLTGGCNPAAADNRPVEFPPGTTPVEFTAGGLACTTLVQVVNHRLSFISGDDDGTVVRTYDIDNGSLSTAYAGKNIYRFRYDQAGERMLIFMRDSSGTLFDIIDVDTGLRIGSGALPAETLVDGDIDPVDPDRLALVSKTTAAGRANYRLRLIHAGKSIGTYNIPQRPEMRDPVAAWSADGKKIAVAFVASDSPVDAKVYLHEWDATRPANAPSASVSPRLKNAGSVEDLDPFYRRQRTLPGMQSRADLLLNTTRGVFLRQGPSMTPLRRVMWGHADLSGSGGLVFGDFERAPRALLKPFETSIVVVGEPFSRAYGLPPVEAAVSSDELYGAILFGNTIAIYDLSNVANRLAPRPIALFGEVSVTNARNLLFR